MNTHQQFGLVAFIALGVLIVYVICLGLDFDKASKRCDLAGGSFIKSDKGWKCIKVVPVNYNQEDVNL